MSIGWALPLDLERLSGRTEARNFYVATQTRPSRRMGSIPQWPVLFGDKSVAATCTATKCTAVSPTGMGRVHVRVVTPSGTSATVRADRFTYR